MAILADSPVPVKIERKSAPRYSGGGDGRRASFTVIVAIDDVTAFVQFAINSVELVDYGGGVTAERVVPLVYPDDPEMHLVGYEIEYFGTPNQGGTSVFADQFSHARIALEFGTLPFGVGGDTPFYSLSAEYSTTMETIPGSVIRFPSDGSSLSGEMGLPMGTISYTLTQYMSTTPIPYEVASIVGSVNSVAWGIFPVGTLRFDGARSEYARGMFSQTLVKSYSLKFRPRPWREVMRADGVWEEPEMAGTGDKKYAAADLRVLAYL